ncbi:MAG: SIMPL domain-containing protein [Actinomycetota bacterium]|nr:SIMPL domain-containing protein [Actinomycetota bacterium]
MSDPTQPSVVSVAGVGVVAAVPDAAVLSVAVTGRDATIGRALELMTGAHAAALAALSGVGVGAERIATAGMHVHRAHDHRTGEPGDFVAEHALRVRLAEVDRAGDVIASLVGACGDRLRLDNVELVVDEPGPLRREARSRAVADARERAAELADAAGARLGRVLELTEGGAGGGPRPMARAELLAAAPAVHPGTTDVTVTVTLTAELLTTD